MQRYADHFGPFGDVAWINTSHQGALPKVAAAAAEEAIDWKRSPHPLIDSRLFSEVPLRLREVLGRLINCPADDVILGNSASYGLHLLANGFPWQPGDEVLLVKGDFPCTILPWLGLAERGVSVRTAELEDGIIDVDAFNDAIGPRTRIFCASWVFSFSGARLDLPAIKEICRERGVKIVLNCSQGIGGIPFDIADGYCDALTCVGFKWLCGPYGTGFCWIEPELRESLIYNQAYWLAMQTADDLKGQQDMPAIREDIGARKYDVFGTANFFNFKPWTEAVDLLVGFGIDKVGDYDQALIQRLIDGLDSESFNTAGNIKRESRSNILFVSHKVPSQNEPLFKKLQRENIYISLRDGRMRFSPHLYNTEEQIDRALDILNDNR